MKFKNILLYAALLSGMSFSSCTDFLDEDSNPNALSPGIFWKSEGDIMKGLTSVYGALQPNASWAIPFERYIVIDGYRSDEITHTPKGFRTEKRRPPSKGFGREKVPFYKGRF